MSDQMSHRREQAEVRREQILNAALEIFSEKSFAGASMRDIARKVGVTEGLLYHYFHSKSDLLQSCWRERSWHAQMEQILLNSHGWSLSEILTALVRDFLNSLYKAAPAIRMCVAEVQRNDELASVQLQQIQHGQQTLSEFLMEKQKAGEIDSAVNVMVAAEILMGAAVSLFMLWNRLPEEEWNSKVEEFVKDGVGLILAGLKNTHSAS
jgi:AcrR family transcriptional regulator